MRIQEAQKHRNYGYGCRKPKNIKTTDPDADPGGPKTWFLRMRIRNTGYRAGGVKLTVNQRPSQKIQNFQVL
jgi:hypothetical protein